MKKKLYNQPVVELSKMMPTTIICVSAGEGPDAPGDSIGD